MEPVRVWRGTPLKQEMRVGPAEIHFLHAGEGPPALFLHGFPTSSDLWRHVIHGLDDRVECWAPDLPGLGETVVSPYADFGLPMLAEHMLEFLDAVEVDRCLLVGHDVGGGVAQIMATLRPERFTGLVLVDSVGLDGWPSPCARRLQRAASRAGAGTVGRLVAPSVGRAVLRRAAWDSGSLDRSVLDAWTAAVRGPDGWKRVRRFLLGLDDRVTRDLDLSVVRAPALVVWGADDPWLPVSLGRRLAEALPHARFASIGWCGHLVPEERPDELVAAIAAFLDTLDTVEA